MSAQTPPPTRGGKTSRKAIAAWICLLALAPAALVGLGVQLDIWLPDFFFSRWLGMTEMAVIIVTLAAALFWPESQKK